MHSLKQGPSSPSLTTTQLSASCTRALKVYLKTVEQSRQSIRKKVKLLDQLFFLLQYLTMTHETTLENASNATLLEWLNLSKGFSDYWLRIELLQVLKSVLPSRFIIPSYSPLHARLASIQELIFWRKTRFRTYDRLSPYFEAITQDEILSAEKKGIPFYNAYHTVFPHNESSGAFVESDEELIQELKCFSFQESIAVTDIGCGKGRLLKRIKKAYPSALLTGTSIFEFTPEETLALTQNQVHILHCPAEKILLPDSSQDLIVSTEVIEHLRHPEKLVAEVYRVLKPGGYFYITAPNSNEKMYNPNPLSYLAVACAPFLSKLWPNLLPPYHHLYAPFTDLKLVHYGFSLREYDRLFRSFFQNYKIKTSRFTSLKKFRLDRLAPHLPILKNMGGLNIAIGRKNP